MGKILLIDDEIESRNLVKEALEEEGHAVAEAVEGKAGIMEYRKEAVGGTPYDLVVTDLVIPEGLDGLEVIIQLKREFPNVTIIALSGGDDSDAHEMGKMAQRFGAFDVFEKPIKMNAFLDAVDDALEQEDEDF